MINDLPIQFIDGINESAEEIVSSLHLLEMEQRYKAIAIKYTPKFSAILSRIDLPILNGDEIFEVRASIYSDYNGLPGVQLTDDALSKIQLTGHRIVEWQSIEMNPATVVSGKVYWFILYVNYASFSLLQAEDRGFTAKTSLKILYSQKDRWEDYLKDDNDKSLPLMLRAYGKILPFIQVPN